MNKQQFNARLKSAASNEERISLMDAYAGDLFEKERYSEAVQIYSQALKIPKQANVKAYFAGRIGICQFNAGNDKEAFLYLVKSERMFDPAQPEFMRDMCGFVPSTLGRSMSTTGRRPNLWKRGKSVKNTAGQPGKRHAMDAVCRAQPEL